MRLKKKENSVFSNFFLFQGKRKTENGICLLKTQKFFLLDHQRLTINDYQRLGLLGFEFKDISSQVKSRDEYTHHLLAMFLNSTQIYGKLGETRPTGGQ